MIASGGGMGGGLPGWAGPAAGAVGDIVGGIIAIDQGNQNRQMAEREARRNRQLQREFAQNGIRWRVEDAARAGLSPLAAIGAAGASYTPSQTLFDNSSPAADLASRMGQNVGRAINATRTQDERRATELELENRSLQNDLLRSQIAQNQAAMNPALPSAVTASGGLSGQGDAFKVSPAEAKASQSGRPAQEAGAINTYGFARSASGGLIPVPSSDMKQRMEDDFFQEAEWQIRNRLLPAVKGLPAPDPRYYPLPKGFSQWKWDPISQEFRPSNGEGRTFRFENKHWR